MAKALVEISPPELRDYHSFKLPARCARLLQLNNVSALDELLDQQQKAPLFILGAGSNVIPAGQSEKTVVRIATSGIEYHGLKNSHHIYRVAAGENWHQLVQQTVMAGHPGLENLALIPGTAGAAPVQNIGAYGVEISRFIESVETCNLSTGQRQTLPRQECGFSYRNSIFKSAAGRNLLITHIHLAIPSQWQAQTEYPALAEHFAQTGMPADATGIMQAVISIRQSKLPDPAKMPNAGSFFKNPLLEKVDTNRLKETFPEAPLWPYGDKYKTSAAWLIEQAGWKGKRMGEVGVSDQHALVLVNLGHAEANELEALVSAIKQDVWKMFQISLEQEPARLD